MIVRQAWADDFANINPREEAVSPQHGLVPEMLAASVAVAVLDEDRPMVLCGVMRVTGLLWGLIDKQARPKHILEAQRAILANPDTPARIWMLVREDMPSALRLARFIRAKFQGEHLMLNGVKYLVMVRENVGC